MTRRGSTTAAPASASPRARCEGCGVGLPYHAWEEGRPLCHLCTQVEAAPAATFVAGPRGGLPATTRRVPPPANEDDLLDELIASLEAEAAFEPGELARPGSAKAVLQEIGFGQTSHELAWTLWGFAAGFTANAAVAKYAQYSSGAGLGEFVPAFLLGGVVVGAACAAIAWGVAKLRDR